MILTFRPIKVWPDGWQHPDRSRIREFSPFRGAYSDTLVTLDREIRHLGAREVTLQVDAGPNGVRLDGQLRADAKVNHPGVILTIETAKLGTLVYACDRYVGRSANRPSWHENLRAIALGLEALRKVERYGIAERGQQYAGYRELPPGAIAAGRVETMTVDEAARLLVELGEWGGEEGDPDDLIRDPTIVDAYYRSAAKRHHPDVGGDPDVFRRLAMARNLLANSGSSR